MAFLGTVAVAGLLLSCGSSRVGAHPHPLPHTHFGPLPPANLGRFAPSACPPVTVFHQRNPPTPGERAQAPINMDCAFEADLCGWTHDPDADFEWTRNQEQTLSSETGPSADHTLKTADGWYVYIESGSPQAAGDKARLLSPQLPAGQEVCLSFWHHIYGSAMGSINVYVRGDGVPDDLVWTLSGNQGDQWRRASVSAVMPPAGARLVLEGVVGKGRHWRSDAALDDIMVTPGPCAASLMSSSGLDWSSVNEELKTLQLPHIRYVWSGFCTRYRYDSPYNAVVRYLNSGQDDLDTLETNVTAYCDYHRPDRLVAQAYTCSTGCRLADHLNQLCNYTNEQELECPAGFTENEATGRCYATIDMADTWVVADQTCKSRGARLVQIDSVEENTYLQGLLPLLLGADGTGVDAFIGANDVITENEWMWAGSFELLNYANWEAGEPWVDNTNTNCAVMGQATGEWRDVACSFPGATTIGICETSKLAASGPVAAEAGSAGGEGSGLARTGDAQPTCRTQTVTQLVCA